MHQKRYSRRMALRGMGAVLCAGMASGPAARAAQYTDTPESEATVPSLRRIPAWYYQHFDADFSLDVPEEGFGGWKQEPLEFSLDHTALVVMHAWDGGTREEYPGWWRCVPYLARSEVILRDVFPPLLAAARASGLSVFHVVGGGDYYKDLPGYRHAVALAGDAPPALEQIPRDDARRRLDAFRSAKVFVGAHNAEDVRRGFARLDFAAEARPADGEGIAENSPQLFALCRERGINHLVYCGFAVNWCLLLSPGGMAEMHGRGMMCSVLRQAVTAVENRESARQEWCKELALWRVALAFGFVFDVADFLTALRAEASFGKTRTDTDGGGTINRGGAYSRA